MLSDDVDFKHDYKSLKVEMQAGNSAKFYPEFRKTFLPMYVIII
jgi:hypothetical protein